MRLGTLIYQDPMHSRTPNLRFRMPKPDIPLTANLSPYGKQVEARPEVGVPNHRTRGAQV
jgi:hypothetical protein